MRRGAKAQAAKEARPYPLGVYGNLECMAFQAKDACGWQQNRQPVMTAPWVDIIGTVPPPPFAARTICPLRC